MPSIAAGVPAPLLHQLFLSDCFHDVFLSARRTGVGVSTLDRVAAFGFPMNSRRLCVRN
jgi:hypothetical protein